MERELPARTASVPIEQFISIDQFGGQDVGAPLLKVALDANTFKLDAQATITGWNCLRPLERHRLKSHFHESIHPQCRSGTVIVLSRLSGKAEWDAFTRRLILF